MHRPFHRRRRQGQAAVLAALCFALLVAALGLALDGANAFGQRRKVSYVADAAALAGARELIAQLGRSSGGTHINNTIESFLTSRHELEAATLSWRAFYIDRLSPDGSLGEVLDGSSVPSAADGVRIELNYGFPTYFMGVFGQRDLRVSGRAAAVYGPLGTAIGQDLAPLAVSNTARQQIQDEGTVRIDLKNELVDAWLVAPVDPVTGQRPPLDSDIVTAADVAHVSFANVNTPPATGNDCPGAPAESLTSWWCRGSPNKLQINRQLPAAASPNFGRLDGAIDWRERERDILVLPEYTDIGLYYQLVGFIAVEIRSYNPGTGVLTVEHLENYATAGSMVGEGSGVETGVWAVNLVR
jgi:hypothetical protein